MAYNDNRNRRNRNNNRFHGNQDSGHQDYELDEQTKKNMASKREVNSLLDFDAEDIIFDDYENEKNDKKNNGNRQGKKEFDSREENPVCKILAKDAVYDRDDVLNLLIKKNGLSILIKDIKKSKKNPNGKTYAYRLFRNVVFASALPEAIDNMVKKDDFGAYDLDEKDMNYLMDELVSFLNNPHEREKLLQYNDEDIVDSMQRAYINIVYKLNKKKVKKFKKIKGMPESLSKQIIVLTAGKNVSASIYRLMKFLYSEASNFEFNKKNLVKIFKICYGKSQFDKVITSLMLEKARDMDGASSQEVECWVVVDMLIRDSLEEMEKKDIEKIIKSYIKIRKSQETEYTISRRLGDRRAIHPDDYPRLTKVFESLESKDFSIIKYLR